MAFITVQQQAAASIPTPSSGKSTVFIDTADGLLKVKNSANVITSLLGTGQIGTVGEANKALSATDWAAINGLIKTHGEAEGKVAPNLAEGGVHTYIAKGPLTLKPPTGAPTSTQELAVSVIIKQDVTGGRSIGIENITWISGEPIFSTTANAINVISLVSWDGGISWFAFGPEKGEKGSKGETGAEGFYPGKLLLPSEVKSWKKPSTNETETRVASAATHLDRTVPSATLTLTSGVPVIAAIPVPAGKAINGVGFALNALENTPANRTHLWVAVLDSSGKVLATGKDYTSSTNTPLTTAKINALLLESTIEALAESTILYAVLCEVMSSTNPITVYMRESNTALTGAKPVMAASGPSGQTTPPVVGSTIAFTESAKEPYMVFV